jgi:hypothetical protein
MRPPVNSRYVSFHVFSLSSDLQGGSANLPHVCDVEPSCTLAPLDRPRTTGEASAPTGYGRLQGLASSCLNGPSPQASSSWVPDLYPSTSSRPLLPSTKNSSSKKRGPRTYLLNTRPSHECSCGGQSSCQITPPHSNCMICRCHPPPPAYLPHSRARTICASIPSAMASPSMQISKPQRFCNSFSGQHIGPSSFFSLMLLQASTCLISSILESLLSQCSYSICVTTIPSSIYAFPVCFSSVRPSSPPARNPCARTFSLRRPFFRVYLLRLIARET